METFRFSLDLPLFLVLDPQLKAMGPIYDSHPIGLLYFKGPWTLDPHVKWPIVASHGVQAIEIQGNELLLIRY
jgi:hypothetical protein